MAAAGAVDNVAHGGKYFTSTPWRGSVLHEGIVVRDDDANQGLGVFATKFYQEGEVIWREQPRVFLQHHTSALFSPTCLNCGRNFGGFADSLAKSLASRPRSVEHFPGIAASGLLDCAELQLPPPVECPKQCGALFCSGTCRDRQLSSGHHRILCSGILKAEKQTAWVEFCNHAIKYHESFILGAYAIAEAMLCVEDGRLSVEDSIAKCTQFHARPWNQQIPESSPNAELGASERLKCLEDSLKLLRVVFDPCEVSMFFELEFYNHLIGMLDLTCVDLNRNHSLEAQVKSKVEELPDDVQSDFWDLAAEWWIAQEKAERDCCGNDEDGDDLSEKEFCILPPFDGVGFSYTLALTNHSCFPNIYMEQEESCELVAKARRPIVPGQQLLMSYVELVSDLIERQQKLYDDYGFRCLCVRCRGEAAYQVLKGNFPPKLHAPLAWLNQYAKEHGLPVQKVAHDVWACMPPDLLLELEPQPAGDDSDDFETAHP